MSPRTLLSCNLGKYFIDLALCQVFEVAIYCGVFLRGTLPWIRGSGSSASPTLETLGGYNREVISLSVSPSIQ